MSGGVLRLGVAGLGRAFTLMLPTLVRHPRVRLVAAADPRADARDRFRRDFEEAEAFDRVEDLCAHPGLDAVYVATPHGMHVEHVRLAASRGLHLLVEKPMALEIADCLAMIEIAERAGVHLLVGHSHSFDLPYLRTRELIRTGQFGAVRMINALNFTDYLYRPRRPEELDTDQGGGAVFSQAPHQVEVVRLLAGSPARTVRAFTGRWDAARPTEGAYSAQIAFEGGAFASLGYSGYGHWDTDALHGWVGEMGQQRDGGGYGEARRKLRGLGAEAEAALKNGRAYGTTASTAGQTPSMRAVPPPAYNHFGLVVVSCERGDLRPMPNGVEIYADEERRFEALPPPDIPRAEVLDEFAAAVLDGVRPTHTGRWAQATVEICLAILRSGRTGADVTLQQQESNT